MRRTRLAVLILLLGLAQVVSAQNFHYQAALSEVPATGFYKIVADVELLSHLQPDLRDLRIVSDKGDYVPYIIGTPTNHVRDSFTQYPILSNKQDTTGNTLLEIQNKANEVTDKIGLIIKNNAVQRQVSLSGSNDRGKWYIIREDLLLTPSTSYKTDEFLQYVSFPLSSYKYFRLTIKNNHSDALNIVSAGRVYSRVSTNEAVYLPAPAPSLKQRDSSDGNSYIRIDQSKKYPEEKIKITITAPEFYERRAILYALSDSTMRIENIVAEFSLSSKSKDDIAIPVTNALHLLLVINNGDNPPLHIASVSGYCKSQTIVARLEKAKGYKLLFGNAAIMSPKYDLEYFRDSIPGNITAIGFDEIKAVSNSIQKTGGEQSKIWLWIAIVSAIAVLGFLTFRLVGNIDKNGG